jgi:fumarate hydratase class II
MVDPTPSPTSPTADRAGADRATRAIGSPLYGRQTELAIENFPISGVVFPIDVVHWLAAIKSAAADVNADLGVLDPDLARRISDAADAVARGDHDDQFPIDVYQTGSGTSSNMNVNEVVSTLTDGAAHPNDHVNLGQSSNDVVPTAVHLALAAAISTELLPALHELAAALRDRGRAFATVVKPGRTHLMDAVPITLGDEFDAYATQIDECRDRIVAARADLVRVPLGGTAVGNGLGTHPEFAERVLERLDAAARIGVAPSVARSRFAHQGARDAIVAASGAVSTLAAALTKICNDLRWLASGPATGLAEIRLPELQKGSSIMPGKVNPVIPEAVLQVAARVIGNHTTVTVAGMQGNFELNVMIPVLAHTALESIHLLANGCVLLASRCVAGIEADIERCGRQAGRSPAIATALNASLGYDRVERIVKRSIAEDRTIREIARDEGVDEAVLDDALDLAAIARGNRDG